ncbi:hypothetical protein ACFFQF_24380 [Haladaptatus pallidirubidus]|uniref:Uncharacterized protein n=1 Tax=Haladaptatus pallidirubidus TaxID=1008152 RepID=A0AAV3UH95_9EURY|nr:hypothetical protein [Haladaptatus pallidirubidus]
MSVSHPGGNPNAQLYEQLKRDVLERVPHITTIEYVPDDVAAKQLQATFDPIRIDPPTGPEAPELVIEWYRQTPHDWFRINYSDPNTGFHAGWHQDGDHEDLGRAHFQYSIDEETTHQPVTFQHETPSLILWGIIENLLEEILPTYHR